MQQFHHLAEIISPEHRFIANVKIKHFNEEENVLFTLIPRNFSGAPVPFSSKDVYNLMYSSYEKIYFFQIKFSELTMYDETPVYKFNVSNYTCVDNLRKEERKLVEYQAVISDFNQVGLATILDVSYSGMKIETDYKIDSEFIEVFFDEENVPRRAMGQICWTKPDPESKTFHYGVELKYR